MRISSRLRKGPVMKDIHKQADLKCAAPISQKELNVLLCAQKRAVFKIGKGLLQAASALYGAGILKETKVTFGSGQNRPARLIIRNAVFAAEDICITDMAIS